MRQLARASLWLGPNLPFSVALGALLVAFLGVGAYFALFGRINHDEGWYLYAGRLVYQGELLYRDFAFFQGPAVPYVYGLPQWLFGEGLDVGRFTSLALSFVTVGLGTRLAFERGGRFAAIIFVSFLLLTPLLLWSFSTTRTEPLSALLLMISAFLLLRDPPRPAASAGALGAATLAAATRLTSAPAAALVLIWVLYRHRQAGRQLLLVLLPGTLAGATALALTLAPDPGAAWFNVVTAQAERHNQLRPAEPWGAIDQVREKSRDIVDLHQPFGVVPVLAFGTAGAAAAAFLDRRKREIAPALAAGGVLAGLGVAAYVPNLVPRAVFPVYFVPMFPLFLVLIASLAGACYRCASSVGRRAIGAAVVGLILLQAATFFAQLDVYTARSDPDLQELRTVARYLRDVVPADGTLLTMETYLAVESGLNVAPGWEMGIFAYFPRRAEPDGPRYHIATAAQVSESLRSGSADAVVLSDTALGILVEHRLGGYRPSQTLTEKEVHAALPEARRYRLDRVFPAFGQFRDNLYILLQAQR